MDYNFREWDETRELVGLERALLGGRTAELSRRRGARKTKRRKKRLRAAAAAGLALLVMVALFALGYSLTGKYFSGGGNSPNSLSEALVPGKAAAAEKVLPVLLLGVDQRPGDVGRADTIIVAFLDLRDREVRLLSVPRDTYVYLPGRTGGDKINASYAYGGPEEAMQAVGDLLGIDIAYYVETNFKGFEKIIDTLGGVTIDVDRRMYYPAEGINLYKGKQKLNGHDALAYVRFRNYPMGDIDRIRHQQVFFSALADQALQVRNIWKIPALVGELRKAVKTNISTARLIQLGNLFRDIDSSKVETYMLPGTPSYINGISYWLPDEAESGPLVDALNDGRSPQDETKETAPAAGGNSAGNGEAGSR